MLGAAQRPDRAAAIGKRLARVFEEELGDITKAEETYRYVLGVEALDAEALANLDRIYTSLEQWPELAQMLEQRVKATTEPHELVELYGRLGQVYEERLVQVDDAIRAYRRIFDELDKTHEGAIQALARIYEQKQAWTGAQHRLRARARERGRRRPRGRDPRQDRAPRGGSAGQSRRGPSRQAPEAAPPSVELQERDGALIIPLSLSAEARRRAGG